MVMTPDERKAKRTAYAREWRANNPERVNAKRRLDPEAHNAYQRAYRASRPGKSREYDQRYRAKDVERRAVQIRRSAYKRLYGITPEDYDRMLLEQGGVCRICGSPADEGKRLHVDHLHGADAPVRGLLCYLCNSGLGMFRDDPVLLRKAARYLNRSSGGPSGPPI